jgi:AraC family transcriptional regulator, regulatory protein of adaptative response / DNA-3-methyladenine glycosylase II
MDAAACYRALCARDSRFDGIFYVGVETTGVYCRPICPARTPARERCRFFARAAEAEREGFRACFRCRPELAPGHATVDSIPRLVRAAADQIEAGYLNERSAEELARSLGVSSRHLRRAMEAELGASPIELGQTRRLGLAKQLLHDTTLPVTDVAFAAGFASVRRFNALFRQRFARSPSTLRRDVSAAGPGDFVALRLDYRPPFAWRALLAFLSARAIPGVEQVAQDEYRRSVTIGECVGWLAVGHDPAHHALRARVSLSLAPKLTEVVARLRSSFDLDARPSLVGEQLRRDPLLRPLVSARPGLRVPGAFDPFEMAVRAVLGQQISVRAATTLSGRLAARFGLPAPSSQAGVTLVFPPAEVLADASVAELRRIGLPEKRALTIVQLARAVAERRVDLLARSDPERVVAELRTLPGIGAWTAQYLAMRALHWPDAFPAGDLALRKALGVASERAAERRAERWRPWRAYAVMHLWSSHTDRRGAPCPDQPKR